MREINSSHDANLAALSDINHSLRQQVIELVLTIAAMRENADLPSATIPLERQIVESSNCDARSARSAGPMKSKA
jgi:hypothetical protein